MRKILVCCATLGAFALASPSAYAGGHGHGNGNGAHQDHTCQGGHNCNTTTTPPPPATPPAPPAAAPTTTTSTTVNVTTNVTNNVTVQAPAPAPVACNNGCAAAPPVVTVVAPKAKHKHCRSIRVRRFRKVWHSGRNGCGDWVRWYTYKKVVHKRRVCV